MVIGIFLSVSVCTLYLEKYGNLAVNCGRNFTYMKSTFGADPTTYKFTATTPAL
jgi:hypothetical protein